MNDTVLFSKAILMSIKYVMQLWRSKNFTNLNLMSFSKTLDKLGSREIGRLLFTFSLLPDLNRGITLAVLNISGNILCSKAVVLNLFDPRTILKLAYITADSSHINKK